MTEPERLAETPDLYGAYPRLSDHQIEILAAQGQRRPMRPGDVLLREGEKSTEFFVILRGKVAVVEGYGAQQQIIRVHGPRRFLGELGLLEGQRSPLTYVAQEAGEVLAVPVARLRALASKYRVLGDLILRALFVRRSLLIELGAGLRIVGSCHSEDTHRIRQFAARNRLPHRWIDLEKDEQAEVLLRGLQISPEETPVVILGGREVLRNPSNSELARAIGLQTPSSRTADYDLVVIGAGPAGLAAAVYGASEGLATVVLDAVATGGQAGRSSLIENYLGFPLGISGSELAERAVIQANKFGAGTTVPAEAVALEQRDGHYVIRLDDGHEMSGRAILIATGVRYRKLDIPRREEFEATSIYYAATILEARLCGADPVAVVGGGNSAGQAAMFLSEYVPRVYLLLLHDDLRRDMSRYLADRIERNPRITVMFNTEVRELIGDDALESIVIENNKTGERSVLPARALFTFIGARPCTQWLANSVELDDHGFVLTGQDVARDAETWRHVDRPPLVLETSWPGVFAAGDTRSGSVKRVASAVGEGAMAVHLVHVHLGQQGSPSPGRPKPERV